jgi:omega-6 fatty acid desaturase (delta-12 desaturase)
MRRPLLPSFLVVACAALLSFRAFAPSTIAFGVPGLRRSRNANSLTARKQAAASTMVEELGLDPSGLGGRPLETGRYFPTIQETKAVIPQHCWNRDTARSMKHLFMDMAIVLGLGAAAYAFIPFKLWAAPLWVAYALVTGTAATGLWVLAHECGHGAFSDNRTLQDTVGFLVHTALLVPYFSWQRSHAVHHRYTNHMDLGESHVPDRDTSSRGKFSNFLRGICTKIMGEKIGGAFWGFNQAAAHLVVGWWAYLLLGETGGHARGITNHFLHFRLDGKGYERGAELFPGRWARKVYQSGAGVLAMLSLLVLAGKTWGFDRVLALYVGPLMVTNAWLVMYTWLQHTDTDVPHFENDNHNFMKGAWHTIDRPYDKIPLVGKAIDWMHHQIGTTHVVHHIDCTIPHYHAGEATEAVKKAFPDAYLYDDTPIAKALWRVSKNCTTVTKKGDRWVWA